MEAVLNLIWDERFIPVGKEPLRYKARRFLEKQVIPALRTLLLALVWLSKNIAQPAYDILIRWVFIRRGLGKELREMSRMYSRGNREFGEKAGAATLIFLLTLASLFVVALLFLLVGFVLLTGKVAERGLAFLESKR